MKGAGQDASAKISFAERVSLATGSEQLRPIFTAGAKTLEIVFSEDVVFADGPTTPGVPDGQELTLRGLTKRRIDGTLDMVEFDQDDFTFSYDQNSFTGKWTFDDPLPDDKYAIHLLDTITDVVGNRLNADWTNDPGMDVDGNPTYDDYTDDPTQSFATDMGDGTAGTMDGKFLFYFALLAGDYGGNGVVNWTESIDGDGNGDGVIDSLDDSIGTAGDRLPLLAIKGADLNDDEIVDGMDLVIWLAGFEDNGEGDIDGDGDADGNDFLLWQQAYGSISAWHVDWDNAAATSAAGLALPVTVGLPPQVLNMIISGSISVHTPYSFDTVDGSGSQLATVPVGGADTISIVFSEDVNVSASSLIVIGLTRGNLPALAEFSYDAATYTASWRFENWTIYGDNYLISLSDAVTDVDGNWLDGEWTNPASINTVNSLVSEFPSGDGTAGGNFKFVMTLLPGDMDLDADVDAIDEQLWWNNYGSTWTDGEFTGDGERSLWDYVILDDNLGTDLQDLWVLADLNGDLDVDDNDLQTIADNYGMTNPTYSDGDINGDGVIDDADLDLAFAQYGLDIDWVA